MKLIIILCFSIQVTFAMGKPSERAPAGVCFDEITKDQVLDLFRSQVRSHSYHGRSLAVYEVDSKGRVKDGVEYRANSKRPIASIQKMLSAYVAFKDYKYIDSKIKYSKNSRVMDVASTRSPSSGYVHNDRGAVASVNSFVSLNKTLVELLGRSANGAGYMLAENLFENKKKRSSQSIKEVEAYYASRANSYAKKIIGSNMTSIFSNPHGLDVYGGISRTAHGSTASEMARLLAGMAVERGGSKKSRFDSYLRSLPGGPYSRGGAIFKPGSTSRAGKTFISLHDINTGKCSGRRVSIAIFGGQDLNAIYRTANDIVSELSSRN